MGCFKIEYFASDARHIELKSDGSIELYVTPTGGDDKPIVIEYRQASILKAMIVAEAALKSREKTS